MRKSPAKHTKVSKLGKVFTAGKGQPSAKQMEGASMTMFRAAMAYRKKNAIGSLVSPKNAKEIAHLRKAPMLSYVDKTKKGVVVKVKAIPTAYAAGKLMKKYGGKPYWATVNMGGGETFKERAWKKLYPFRKAK